MRRLVIAPFIFACNLLFAQSDDVDIIVQNEYVPVGEITPKHTVNVMIGLPNTSLNKPFASIMKGIADLNIYYQYSLPNSLVFGGGGRYSHFAINEFRVPEPMDGVMNSFGAFVKFGHEKFYTTRFAMDFSVKVGYNWHSIKTDLNTLRRGGNYNFDSGFVEPIIGFILSATEKASFRLTASYTIQGFVFSLQQLGTNMNGGYNMAENQKSSQFFTFGLGYTYYFGQKN